MRDVKLPRYSIWPRSYGVADDAAPLARMAPACAPYERQPTMSSPDTTDEPVTLGSVWAAEDGSEVVIVTCLDQHGFAVSAFGWVSYGCEGSTNFGTLDGFRHEYPKFVFRVREQAP